MKLDPLTKQQSVFKAYKPVRHIALCFQDVSTRSPKSRAFFNAKFVRKIAKCVPMRNLKGAIS